MVKLTDRFIALCALWAILCLVPAHMAAAATEAPPPSPPPAAAEVDPAGDDDELRDPEALAELKRATDFLTALPRFHIRSTIYYDVVQEDERLLQFEKHGDLYLQRPDRIFADVSLDDGRHRQFWYDGKTLSFAELSRKLHTQVKAPPTIDGMLDMLEGLFKDPMPLADLLYSDLSPLQQFAEEADVVGDSLVSGRPCRQLSFRGQTVDWQVWVEQGTTPYIRKVVISYREQPGTPQVTALLEQWETPERFSDGLFTFSAPAGSQWINVLVPMPRTIEEGGQP
jgi:hypothetical protein